MRFTALADAIVQPQTIAGKLVPGWYPPTAVGRYLYIAVPERTTVDVVTGRVVGRARPDARLAAPSCVAIP